jgi:hypothetical protein
MGRCALPWARHLRAGPVLELTSAADRFFASTGRTSMNWYVALVRQTTELPSLPHDAKVKIQHVRSESIASLFLIALAQLGLRLMSIDIWQFLLLALVATNVFWISKLRHVFSSSNEKPGWFSRFQRAPAIIRALSLGYPLVILLAVTLPMPARELVIMGLGTVCLSALISALSWIWANDSPSTDNVG